MLSVSCAKIYRVSDQSLASSATILWSYQGCRDVTITTAIFERGQNLRFQLMKRYSGQMGFLHFLQDFAGGSHRFSIDELESADPSASDVRQSGVSSVQVFYQIDAPSLEKLFKEATPPSEIVS